MKEEISKILKMVEEGKIDADKATEMISLLNSSEKKSVDIQVLENTNINKMLKVKVLSVKGDNVDVNIPIKFVKKVLDACGKIPYLDNDKLGGEIDLVMIAEAINSDITGKIVQVKTSDGDTVEVSIE